MTDQVPTAPPKVSYPYTSFKSVMNVVQRFKENGLPPRIDRSVLGGSEGQKTQIIATFRFLGFVKDNGEVTDLLTRIVNATDKERQAIIKELLAKLYPKATELASVNATTKQLEETFTGLSGDTLRKATAFYLHAAKFSGHPISKHFKVPSFIARTTGPRRSSASSRVVEDVEELDTPADPISDAKNRYIEMLLDKASKADELDTTLLDRIEKLLGYPNGGSNA